MIKQNKYSNMSKFHAGFIAIVGAPNVGKSTLLNSILGHKISITSNKPQTTRNRILGILTKPLVQYIFIDTPGVHNSSGTLNTRIIDISLNAILDVDLVLLVIDSSNRNIVSEEILLDKLKNSKKNVILAINKIDKIKKDLILEIVGYLSKIYKFSAIIPICALNGDQVVRLLKLMINFIPESPPLFPSETITDCSDNFIISEIIREKVFRLTGQEIPYSVAVTVDKLKERKKHIYVYATIHLERHSQKGIIIGKSGKKIRQIGQTARVEIEKLLGVNVFLKLFIRVQKNWSKDTKALRKFGY